MYMKRITAFVLAGILALSSLMVISGCSGGRCSEAEIGTDDIVAASRVLGAAERSSHVAPQVARLSAGEVLEGHDPREGFVLAPTMFGLAGVDTLSAFVLRIPEDFGINPAISIDGQEPPQISREDARTFTVTPSVALTPNSVYVFRLSRDGERDITWAFQTAIRFEITGTLPRHEATNVPVHTGIEISFSYGDAPDISEFFSIYPHAEGRFISRDSTAVFAPTNPLAYSTVYTVRLREGVALPGTSEVIGTERVFSFETAPAPNLSGTEPRERPRPSSFSFFNLYVEFPSFAVPMIDFRLSVPRNRERPAIEFNVYRIEDRAQAITALERISGVHRWSRFSAGDGIVDTSLLLLVESETIYEELWNEPRWRETFTLPNTLPPGFYVLTARIDEEGSPELQMIIQITDLAIQMVGDNDRALLWINDMNTGRPLAAQVYDPVSRNTTTASAYGIAVLERRIENGEYLVITAGNMESILPVRTAWAQSFWHHGGWDRDMPSIGGWSECCCDWSWGGSTSWGSGSSANNIYWTALQLDRTLFQRSDTLHLWGFVQNRREREEISHVTAVITQGSWWHGRNERDILHMQNVPVFEGSYSGEIRLPHLDPGFYQLTVRHGDIVLNTMFFNVQDYVKPPYQLTVSSSHNAIFAGDTVTFYGRTEFFEGTPVPDLSLSFGFSGHELTIPGRGTMQTNIDGVAEVHATPFATNERVQGIRSLRFSAEATLPEIGWVHESSTVRVFVNDINVRPRASRDGRDASITVDVHNITLDRINDNTMRHSGDFLCEPRAEQVISVEIVEQYWVAVRTGEHYCHVTRQVIPRYRHEHRENTLERFNITTNADGVATREFTVPDIERRTYLARISTTDGNGRVINHTTFIGRNWESFFRSANDNRLFLYGANREGYDIGDEVELTVMRGAEQVAQGNFLFIVVQNEILSYHVGTNPLTFTFGEEHVPNTQVFAYHFNGHRYNTGGTMSQRLRFNPENRRLVINIETCQEYYRPGETPTFIVTTTDEDGNPKAAHVNISLVDEALFALMDYTVDTLTMLYRSVSDSLRLSIATHRTFISDGIEGMYAGMEAEESGDWGGDSYVRITAEASPAPGAVAETQATAGGADTRIRERFEDTAMFASVRTNSQGVANITFPLPDNVTSWRVTASGISNDLYAGNTIQNVRVTLPMFLHHTLSRTFLVGDIPTIGVNAFGTALAGGESVRFYVWREDSPEDVRTASGVAFERVNIPLWEKTDEGVGAIVVRAQVAGFGDAVRHEFQVVNSHRLIDTASFYEVTTNTVFATNPVGLTNITFTNYGRGQFLSQLMGLRHTWHSGARIEGLVAAREAHTLTRENFPEVRIFGEPRSFDISNYQTQSGGIAILPYSDAELEVTVKLMPFIMEEVNRPALRNYLLNIFETSTTDNKMLALYGLAILGEPVLFDLQNYAIVEDLSVRNTAYIALAFAALGDLQAARNLYNERIAPHVQTIVPQRRYRVNAGANRAEILDATSVTALLAAKLGQPQALGLHNYATTARHAVIWEGGRFSSIRMNDAMLLNLERLNFIANEIENHTAGRASITYTLFGETRTRNLGYGGQFTLRIPAQNMHEFQLTNVTGQVGAVSIVRTPLEDIETINNDVIVRRQFFRQGSSTPSTTFAQDELVRVEITVTYSATDLAGTYVITDFLPAGLTHVAHSARMGTNPQNNRRAWVTTEGQRVSFFDHNSSRTPTRTYFYYARVVNPGTFRAEGTIVQSHGAREYLAVGECMVITVN